MIGLKVVSKDAEDRILGESGYSRDKLASDIQALRQWITYQHHFPSSSSKENDAFLTNFLLGSKGSLERCKQKLENYYTARSRCALFDERDPEELIKQNEAEITGIWTLPETGGACLFAKCVGDNLSNFDFKRMTKRILNQIEIFLRLPVISTSHFWVGDGSGYEASRVLKLNPLVIKDFLSVTQKVFPFRIKAIIFINAPSLLETAVNSLVKPLLPAKLADRLHVYAKGVEMLNNHFELSQLPRDLGGQDLSREELYEMWTKLELRSRSWFLNEGAQKVDEYKRAAECRTNPSFGVRGSLRAIEFD